MVFSSYSFLLIAFPILLIVYYLIPSDARNAVLLLFSLGFYAWSGPKYLLLMLASITINYVSGLAIDKWAGAKIQNIVLAISVILNLILLFYFKYFNFLIDNINSAFKLSITLPEVILPIGISFYTFQGISYVVDVKRGDAKFQKNPFKLALFISLFPQLIAGPIVRYADVAEDIDSRSLSASKVEDGMFRFAVGLAKKVLVANMLGEYADYAFALEAGELSLITAWLGALCFTLQIYYDFSGYSDMAIGIGQMLGFCFCENFNYPYIADSITEFWRRWHISLSSWFRDYVYIPLGGNRRGTAKQILNIMIVWMLTGLWHGASWNFVLWGGYYAILLILEKFIFAKFCRVLPKALRHILTLLLVVFGWVIFQASDLAHVGLIFRTMADCRTNCSLFINQLLRFLREYGILFCAAVIGATPVVKGFAKRLFEKIKSRTARMLIRTFIFVLLLFFSIMRIVVSSYNPFIYFRF